MALNNLIISVSIFISIVVETSFDLFVINEYQILTDRKTLSPSQLRFR